MFKSLKNKLLAYFLIINVLVFIGFSVFIYETAKKGVVNTIDAQLALLSIDAVVDLKGDAYIDAKALASELRKEFGLKSLELKIIYYDRRSKSIEYETVSGQNLKELFDIPLDEMGHLYSVYYFTKKSYRVSSMLLYQDNSLKIFFQLATKNLNTTPYLDSLRKSLLFLVPLLILFLLFIANILLSKSLNPVKATVDAVNEISANELSERLSTKDTPLEIKALIDTFNALLERLEKTFNRISTFSADASHELKTPLTVIRGEAEVALRKERNIQEYQQVLKDIVKESTSVQVSIEQLFLLTKKDTKELSDNFQELYLDEVLGELLASLHNEAMQKSIKLSFENIVPATIFANENLLKIAVSNLIRNAIIYSDEGSEIILSLTKESDISYRLCIEDKGCGISKDDLALIFERFYRVDKSRSRQKGGTGLGLAIVKMILDLHQYSIDIQSVLGGGTRVLIMFKKVAE